MIRLLFNYYIDKNPTRKKEIDFCLQKNLANPYLTTIVIDAPGKPTYQSFFQKINEITQPDDVNIICNSDIFFDDTIQLASNIKHREMYALLRWEWRQNGEAIFSDRPDSQDTWIFKGRVEDVFGNFTLGLRGCDNRIAAEFQKSGYVVRNPSKSIKTYHVHTSNVRNYTMADVVPPPYHTLPPTEL